MSVHGDKPLIDTAKIIVEGREDMDKKIIDGPKPYDTSIPRADKRKTITTENVKNYVYISDEYTNLKQMIDINFQGLDFKYVMSLMADIADINILVGDEVSGTVNAKVYTHPDLRTMPPKKSLGLCTTLVMPKSSSSIKTRDLVERYFLKDRTSADECPRLRYRSIHANIFTDKLRGN